MRYIEPIVFVTSKPITHGLTVRRSCLMSKVTALINPMRTQRNGMCNGMECEDTGQQVFFCVDS